MKRIAVVGATGNVGRAVVLESIGRGWHVAAMARSEAGLKDLADGASSPRLTTTAVDLTDEPSAPALPTGALPGRPDAVVIAVNTWSEPRRMLQWSPEELQTVLGENLATQLAAARTYIPELPPGGVYLAAGGATADHLLPGNAHLSVTQAALRMMVRAISKEEAHRGVHVRQLLIAATVRGHHNQELVGPATISAAEVALRVCDIVADPERFAGTLHQLPSP